ncbi:MAG: bacteriophage abortive infection AbiH family protein [Bacteroidales bacterium]|nr:bacteriophage abortive infection AbiH family protein [Bacteroidales bacterium]
MNRLIIIGNGFDLAHGLKTSSSDFLLNYFSESINNFYKSGKYSDLLLEVKFANDYFSRFGKMPELATSKNVLKKIENIQNGSDFVFNIHSKLLVLAYEKLKDINWVDLEIEFFNVLIETRKLSKEVNAKGIINLLNNQLDFLKSKLIKYLDSQQKEYNALLNKKLFIDCFCEQIKKQEVVTVNLSEDVFPDNLYFLNFNYTNTFQKYLDLCRKQIPSQFNFIHGNLNGEYGDPIFGFGDEFDKRFLEFEDDRNNELFKYIKSFEYLKTKNYYSLTRFIESNSFQVHIYGHSCGISDRTLLNQIFEHKHCESIKVYYHKIDNKNNDFTEKSYEIARHFKDKVMLRKKLVPFELSREMPQPMI